MSWDEDKVGVFAISEGSTEVEDTQGAIRIRISRIPKGQSESVYRRYQRGNQNPYIEEEQTTQWPKEKLELSSRGHYKLQPLRKWHLVNNDAGLTTCYHVNYVNACLAFGECHARCRLFTTVPYKQQFDTGSNWWHFLMYFSDLIQSPINQNFRLYAHSIPSIFFLNGSNFLYFYNIVFL